MRAIEARLQAHLTHVKAGLDLLKDGDHVVAVVGGSRGNSKEDLIKTQEDIIYLCEGLMEMSDQALTDRARDLFHMLSPSHVANWTMQKFGIPTTKDEDQTAWTEQDLEVRMELDLILVAFGQKP